MKMKFSYQKVLDFKEKEKEIAQQEFGTSKLKQMEVEEQLEGLAVEKEKIFNQYNDTNRKSVWQILEVQQEIDHVNLQMKKLEHQSQQIYHEVEQRHQVLIEKTQEAKIWNQWKAKSTAAFQKQIERKEQAFLDELSVLRSARRV
jgi:flagellar protein FliJ